MIRRPPRSTRTDTLFPYTTLFRSIHSLLKRGWFLPETCTTSIPRCAIADGEWGVPMLRLPPLGAIEAFVTVARMGSIKNAAEVLALSPSALSRRVQTLENRMGEALFERKHQALSLTIAGRSEEHTSELQSLMRISYAFFCLKK